MSPPSLRAFVPEVAQHLGLPPVAVDWSGYDAVSPILEEMRREGAIVLLKLDGGRGERAKRPYTTFASSASLGEDPIRIDARTVEDALAHMIVEYAMRCWDFRVACPKCGYILRGITEPRCPECGERI